MRLPYPRANNGSKCPAVARGIWAPLELIDKIRYRGYYTVARRYEFYVLVARTIGSFRFEYEYEIEYEYNFSIAVFRLHIITTHANFIP